MNDDTENVLFEAINAEGHIFQEKCFDVLSGSLKRAPAIWQRLGIEWLYRIVQEPRRMWRRYLVTNTLFCGMLVREMFKRRRAPRR